MYLTISSSGQLKDIKKQTEWTTGANLAGLAQQELLSSKPFEKEYVAILDDLRENWRLSWTSLGDHFNECWKMISECDRSNKTFQQDGAPCHTAKMTQKWYQANLSGFIPKDCWPPVSPDLNPLDYFVWSYLESKVNGRQHTCVESLKRSLLKEWENIPLRMCRAAIKSWKRRIVSCIRAEGRHFEFWQFIIICVMLSLFCIIFIKIDGLLFEIHTVNELTELMRHPV